MSTIQTIKARQILDSRGFPTVEVDVILHDGSSGRASVPSGASTGSLEAYELRDGGSSFYRGKGVTMAVSNVNDVIAPNIVGLDALEQSVIDYAMIDLDGKSNKSNLGSNSILAVSLAVAKAAAAYCNLPLYKYIGGSRANIMPVPMMNILNGGKHADNAVEIQEFMIMPVGAKSFSDGLRFGAEIFHCLKDVLKGSGMSVNVGDEGGFAPNVSSAAEALNFIMRAIEEAGYKPESEVAIALDCAASEFFIDGVYKLSSEGKAMTAPQLIQYYKSLCNRYPIFSIEDAFAEDDTEGFKKFTADMGDRIQIVGDDLFVTNAKLIESGIRNGIANSVLIKPNQIGTLTETLKAVEVAHKAGYTTIMSHRSGETEDVTIAHLAVACGCGQIKTGSLCRTDRVAKYNELLRIEEQLSPNFTFCSPVK